MRRVRLDRGQLGPALIVETEHQPGIPWPGADVADLTDIVIFPETVTVSECAYAGLCADSGSGKHCHFLFVHFTKYLFSSQ